MKADLTRLTFKRDKHYNSVRMQQGRVQMDADWNEQVEIQAHLRNTQSTDVIGACGAPRLNAGFEITADGGNLLISPGRMYVDGLLCENEPGPDEPNAGKRLFTEQPSLPGAIIPGDTGLYAVYLDVWERHMTAVEDAAIREVALGGPDTATRTQTLWQVKLQNVNELNEAGVPLTCWDMPKTGNPATPWLDVVSPAKGFLSARAAVSESETKPCIIAASAGYRRLENQLYRVEIHEPGTTGVATFKWSRDNGILVSRVLNIIADRYVLVVSSTGKDDSLSFGPGQWVEVTDEEKVLRGEPGLFFKVKTVEGNAVVLDIKDPVSPAPPSPEKSAWDSDIAPRASAISEKLVTIRRWEGTECATIPAENDGFLRLEEGVEVKFTPGYTYNTGDYWLIPARTVGGDVEWPKDEAKNPIPQPPHGIYHHYCKLALVDWDGSTFTVRDDCRPLFPALNEPDLVYVSGDGQEAMPDTPLPQPLRVGVYNCNRPIEGAWVMFKVKDGNGLLQPPIMNDLDEHLQFPKCVLDLNGNAIDAADKVTGFIVPTDRFGQAYCIWHMQHVAPETTAFEQLVETTLLQLPEDLEKNKLDTPVMFGASLAVAWEDRYGGSVFPDQQYPEPGTDGRPSLVVHTVEDALDQLRQNVALYYVSGDGQEAKRLYVQEDGAWVLTREGLKQPLVVRAANGDWPFGNAEVRFKISVGMGSIQPAAGYDIVGAPVILDGRTTEFVVKTKADGLAECVWELDWELDGEPDSDTKGQQVTATLDKTLPEDTDNFAVFPSEVRFNASLSIAGEVSYDGSDFPDIQHPGLVVHTVEDALDLLRENTALYYVGGDGQEARRGERLQQPLQVRVANGQWPRKDAIVRFIAHFGTLEDADGAALTSAGNNHAEVPTNEHGIAEAYWRLNDLIAVDGSSVPSQQVSAILVDPVQLPIPADPASPLDSTKPSPGVVRFTANLSIAKEVTYDGARFPETQHSNLAATEVENALDQLRENVGLYYVGGNGQEVLRPPFSPGSPLWNRMDPPPLTEELQKPLQVRAANGDWPFAGAMVKFEITAGSGALLPANEIILDDAENAVVKDRFGRITAFNMKTDSKGQAECRWHLDRETFSQQVTASLVNRLDVTVGSGVVFPSEIRFSANLSIAEQVSYDPLTGKLANTVQAALDDLYLTKVDKAGDTITGNLRIEGNLTVEGDQVIANTVTLEIEDNIIRVNKYPPQDVPADINGGLEVFRGGTAENAQIIWDEGDDHWKVGVENNLIAIATVEDLPSGVARNILQPGHQFIVGQAIYYDAANKMYALAQSNSETTTGMFLVSRIIDMDNFTLVQAGYVKGLTGLKPGEYYFVSAGNPGELTPDEPTGISNPLLFADSETSGYVLPYRPSESSQELLKEYVDNLLAGSVSAFAMEKPPGGWLECNGQAIARIQYARLFTRIGIIFGPGNGKTTFNVPDLRGEFVRGWDHEGKVDVGRVFGSKQDDQIQTHKHNDAGHGHTDKGHAHSDSGHAHPYYNASFSNNNIWPGGNIVEYINSSGYGNLDNNPTGYAAITTGLADIQTGYSQLGNPADTGAGKPRHGAETRSRNMALMYCIKY